MTLELRRYPFNANNAIQEIKKLPFLHLVAFCASVCERSILVYADFTKEEKLDTLTIARKALDEVWLILEGKTINLFNLSQLRISCEEIIPEPDTYSYEYEIEASSALDSICYLLDIYLQNKIDLIQNFTTCIDSIIFSYLSYEIEKEANEKLDKLGLSEIEEAEIKKSVKEEISITANHPLMVREMKKENEDLQLLKEIPNLTPEFVRQFRNSALEYTNGKSLIDLS